MHKKHLKNSTLFHNKNTQKLIEGNLFNIIKAIYEKSIANIILNDERQNFSSKTRSRQKIPDFINSIQLESYNSAIR